jgi:HEAT repeat protein
MVDLLEDVKDPGILHNLTRSIVEAGGRDGVESLLNILENGSLTAHRLHPICGSIAEAGSPEDAERLFQLLGKAHHPEGTRALLKAAVSLSGEEGFDHCLGLLQESEEGDVRAAAADIIGHRGASAHLPQLMEVLGREEFGRAQWQLTRAIAMAGDEGMAQLEQFLLEDRNVQRKNEILSSIANLEDRDAIPLLTRELIEDSQPHIREHAAEILSKTGDDRAIHALADALHRETDTRVKERISNLLDWAWQKRKKP